MWQKGKAGGILRRLQLVEKPLGARGPQCSSQKSRCVGPWGLPGAPLLTGLPPRSSRHWRRSALPPGGYNRIWRRVRQIRKKPCVARVSLHSSLAARRRKGAMKTSKKWRKPLFRQPKKPFSRASFPSGKAALLWLDQLLWGDCRGSPAAAANRFCLTPAACHVQRRRFSLLHAHLQPLDLPGAFIYDPGKGKHNGQQQP